MLVTDVHYQLNRDLWTPESFERDFGKIAFLYSGKKEWIVWCVSSHVIRWREGSK